MRHPSPCLTGGSAAEFTDSLCLSRRNLGREVAAGGGGRQLKEGQAIRKSFVTFVSFVGIKEDKRMQKPVLSLDESS